MDTMLPTPRRALIDLDERRTRMLASARGRVLDVSTLTRSALLALPPSGEQYDTIVSVGQISMAPDPGAVCRALAALLARDGDLAFLEPTAVGGAVGAVQHAIGPWMRRATGRRPDYDVPALLRAAGLSVVDCERFTARGLWPYRSFVDGVARHVARAGDDAS